MDDRKLLELAADAINRCVLPIYGKNDGKLYFANGNEFNPLDNKAQTLELEIKLRLDVVAFADEWHVTKRIAGKTFSGVHADRQRATTMCAAEIGGTL